MSRIFKIVSIILGITLLIGVSAAVLLITLINPNNFKNQISAAVSKNTGRQLTISGNVEWNFFPRLGLHLQQLILANPLGFNQSAFAQIGKLDLNVRILPLFTGHINFDKIILQDVTLNLLRNKQGKTNWEDLNTKNAPDSKPTFQPATSDDSNAKKFDLVISSIVINNATITWQDQQTGQSATIKQLYFNTSKIGINHTFPIQLQFALVSNQPAVQMQLSASSDIELMPQQGYYAFKELDIKGQWFDPKYANGQLPFSLNTDVILKGQQSAIQLNNLSAQIANLPLKGQLTVQKFSKNSAIQGQFSIASFNPRQLLTALGQNIHFANNNVMQSAAADGTLHWVDGKLQINNLQSKLDDMNLTGVITVAHTNVSGTQINTDLAIDQLYPDRYKLAVTPPTQVSAPASPTVTPNSNVPSIPAVAQQHSIISALFAVPKGINILGSLRIGQFRLQNITLTNVNLQYILQHTLLKLVPITADFYQGKSLIQFTADARGAIPQIKLNNTLTNIQMSALLKDLVTNPKTQITGTGNITSHLQTQGQNEDAWLNNLNGDMNFSVANGTITNMDLGKQIYTALQWIIKQGAPTQAQTNQTNFSSLTGTVQIEHGVASNNDLLLKSDSLQVSGKGTIDLRNQQLDYHLSATALGSPFGSDVLNAQQKIGGHIPIKISGTFNDLKILPDLEEVTKSAAKTQLKEQVQKVLGKDVNDTLKKLGDILGQ